MEPGLRDREYPAELPLLGARWGLLQWSPVLETGNTAQFRVIDFYALLAAMEPGLRDREYRHRRNVSVSLRNSCNGARS